MAALKDRLQSDLRAAMKARDDVRRRTLRMVLTAVTTEEVAGEASRELTDDEVLTLIGREAKRRREAAEAFTGGGRADLAEREREEGVVLAAYLPAQLGDEELGAVVDQAITETGASSPRDMGAVMKAVLARVGSGAEGGRVAALVRSRLTG